jgi:hypothetical protein
MSQLAPEIEELKSGIERLRKLLEMLVVRGLRACGENELLQLRSLTEYLEQAGAGYVASILNTLHTEIEKNSRDSASTLLQAQTAIRLLERLLTLRVVRGRYDAAIAQIEPSGGEAEVEIETEDDEEEE